MKKFLRFLAVIGALWNVTPKAAGAEAKENDKVCPLAARHGWPPRCSISATACR